MDISPTYAKQEVDVIKRLVEQSGYSERLDKVKFELSQFEGKHFRNLTIEQLLKRVENISTKFKIHGLINNYFVKHDTGISVGLQIIFDIKDKVPALERYREQIENRILKTEMQDQSKKSKYCWLDYDNTSFHFTIPNGSVQTILLYSQRSRSDHMFLFFKVLYEHWLKFGDQVISKGKIKSDLDKLGWHDVSDENIKNYIGNLRTKLIAPAKLAGYIKILSDRKQQGYKLKIMNS